MDGRPVVNSKYSFMNTVMDETWMVISDGADRHTIDA